MNKQERFMLVAIVSVPTAIIGLNKIYHTIYQFLFPCVSDSYYCYSPMLPGLLTFFTSLALISFVVYLMIKDKL